MNKEDLIKQIKEKKSFLCLGLDTDVNKCLGILFISVSNPTHKKDFFFLICFIRSSLFI